MKEFPKTYEDVFTRKKITKFCKLNEISFNGSLSTSEYIKTFQDFIRKSQLDLFDMWIKVYWLMTNFTYGGVVKKRMVDTSLYSVAAMSIFCRNYINFHQKLFTHSFYFNKVSTYFNDFFPRFSKDNPFKVKYEYPFKFMNLDCLCAVYQLPDRIELLKTGEERRMTYPEFLDYAINHVSCQNDESNKKLYKIIMSNVGIPPYIKYEKYANNRKFKRKKAKTCSIR